MLTGLAFYIIVSPSPPYFTYSSIQRKNGLFKKAYELGVLCSVEVAVIIFGRLFNNFYPDDPDSIFIVPEERPGHHVKLYQYGSNDIHDIVQRHLRVSPFLLPSTQVPTHHQHDGEKDTRGPQDFSGSANTKLDDGDDDDADEDEDLSRSVKKRGLDGKLKSPQDLANVRGVTASKSYQSSHLFPSRWTTVLAIVFPSLSRYLCMVWLLLRVAAALPYPYPV